MASKTLVTTWDQDQGGSAPSGHRNVQIVITEVGNDLQFDISILSPQSNDDLRALFFDVKDDAIAGLTIKESWVEGVRQSNNFSSKVEANAVEYVVDKNEKLSGNYDNHKIQNSTFDVGVAFPGGNSGITSASFVLTGGADRKLTLDLVSEELFGIRVHGQKLIISGAADGVNTDPVVAPNKQVTTDEDILSPAIAIGATDGDGDALRYAVKEGLGPQKGTVAFDQAAGTFTYTPNANVSGTDSFTILVSDGRGGVVEQKVSVTINPINDAPVARPVSLPDQKQGDPIVITDAQLLAGASDIDGDVLTVSSLSLESGMGTVVRNADGTWTFTPDAQQSGAISFRYTVSDGQEQTSSTAALTLIPAPDKTDPNNGGSELAGTYDDLIEAGDGDDIIHGGRGNDEMQGEAGNDTIIGGTDDGRLVWDGNKLKQVSIGDNLYGNDGADTYFYAKGDGVDLIWDFRPDEDTVVLGYASTEIIGATYVRGVTNRIETPTHDKIALILGKGATTHDAIIINDFGGLRDSTRAAFVFADGKTMSMQDIIALIESKPVVTSLPETWLGVPGSSNRGSGRANNSLDLFGSNEAEALIGRAGDDRLYGNEGFNQLNGNDGRDELYGGNVRDVLIGGAGEDFAFGNGGADTIVGGVGSDKLYGAGGADIIYGDTDTSADGRDFSYPGFDFRFNLGLEEKYGSLFQSADPVGGIGIRPGDLAITKGKNWWGGFEVTLTVKAEASLGNWSLFLNSAYEITSIWGAELSKVKDGKTSDLFELKNAPWNGSLAKGQTTTIGFTVRTPFDRVVESEGELLKGLKIGTTATLDQGVASAVSDINKYLNGKTSVIASESYTLTGSAQRLAALSGSKAIDLAGNKLGNTIVGNDGANEIAGRAGKDVLTGKKGNDAFIFDTALSKSNVDTITDFNVKDDRLLLDDSIFKKLGSGTASKAKQLSKNFFSLDKAKDTNDYLIYNKKTGVLSYDADGSGKGQAIEFTKIKAGLELKFSHVYII